jgi:hypothetical protein
MISGVLLLFRAYIQMDEQSKVKRQAANKRVHTVIE